MRAIVCNSYGPPEDLVLTDVADPTNLRFTYARDVAGLVAAAQQAQEQLEPVLSALPQEARDLILLRLTKTVTRRWR